MKILDKIKTIKKRYITAGVVAFFIVFMVISGMMKNKVEYETAPIERRTITQVVEASGTINPVNTVSVGSTVSGLISAIYVDFNSVVKKVSCLQKLTLELSKQLLIRIWRLLILHKRIWLINKLLMK